MTITIVNLVYSINFHDADDGDCYAGKGSKIIRAFQDDKKAELFIQEWNPIFQRASEETTVFPIQPDNKLLKNEFGFTAHDINYGYDFRLVSELVKVL
jgi:hypothetical protein